MNKGSSHDSSAFGNTKLFDLLKEQADNLRKEGLFLVGDSAYPIYSFLQVPYDQQEVENDPVGAKDGCNYHLSADRIYIECAFGELVMRWGIFWRTLRFNLKKNGNIILAAMLLHNFIIESGWETDNVDEEQAYFRNFTTESDSSAQLRLTSLTQEPPRALVTDNNEPKPVGRPTISESQMLAEGESLRNTLMLNLAKEKLTRPTESGMKYNEQGHIYVEY